MLIKRINSQFTDLVIMPETHGNRFLNRTLIFIAITGIFLVGFINFNFFTCPNVIADSGAPAINGTTTETWYVDSPVNRVNEIIATRAIWVNATGRMEWNNVEADITGDVLVKSGGYFNLTNCVLKLTGNLTVNGTVNFKSVILKFNSRSEGEFFGEVWGEMHITDQDSDNATSADASQISAFDTNYNYAFKVFPGAKFSMRYSFVFECGYYSPPYSKGDFGFFIEADNTIIENNTFENDYVGIVYYYSKYNLLANNTLGSNTDGAQLWGSSWNSIVNNIISGNTDDGIELAWSSNNNTFAFNTITGSGDDGMDIDAGCDNNRVLNNTFENNNYGTMITDADGNLVANNTYIDNFYTGAGLYSTSTNNRIIDNYATGSIAGFSAVTADGNYFARNCAESNTMGFMFQGSSNNLLEHNKMTSNSWYGASLEQTSSGNHIHYNNITGNGLRGVRAADSGSSVNATLNWWGDSTGPYHSSTNTGGKGDQVTNYVTYKPWLKKSLEDIDPSITTTDNNSSIEDQYYEHTYGTYDANVGDVITWNFDTDAAWLSWGASNLTLYGSPDNSDVGASWVRINVTYGYGGSDEHNFTLAVQNAAPKILTADTEAAYEDESYSVDYNSDDDGQGNITWKLATNATWLAIDALTGNLSGTPGNDDVGTFRVNVTVFDGNGGEDARNFTLTVINTNDAPVIQTADITTAESDIYYEVVYAALDIDLGDILTWTFATSAGWLSWGTANHTLYGTPQGTDAGSYWIRINVSDGNGGYDEHNFTVTVTNTNDPPVITTADKLVAIEDKHYVQAYSATDADIGDTLSWSLDTNALWLSWSAGNNSLFGLPKNKDVGSYRVWVNVTDDKGGADSHDFILTVINANDPPEITSTDKLTAVEDENYVAMYTAVDEDPWDELTWTCDSDAAWLAWDAESHMLSGTPENADVGQYSISIRVTDLAGAFDEHLFVLSVENTNDPPVITTADVTKTKEDEPYRVEYKASDVDADDKLAWSLITDAGWLKIGPSNGTLYGTPGNDAVETYDVSVKVTDISGVSDEHVFELEVIGINDAPVWRDLPAEVYIEEDYTLINGHPLRWLNLNDYVIDIDNTEFDMRYTVTSNSNYSYFKVNIDVQDWLYIDNSLVENHNGETTVGLRVSDGDLYSDTYFVVKTVPENDKPTIAIDSPDDGSVVSGEVTITGTAYDVEGLQKVMVKIDDGAWSTAAGTYSWIHVWDTTLYPDGQHTVTAVAYDNDAEDPKISDASIINLTINIGIPDGDRDGDGYPDGLDRFPDDPAEWKDTDLDNIGDNADADDDNDGVLDENDAFPQDPDEWLDTDGDGNGNNADPDDDNDGINDSREQQLGTNPTLKDSDYDGHDDGDDEYPLDPTRWEKMEKETGEEESNIRMIIVIIIIIIAIMLFFLFIVFRGGAKAGTETDEGGLDKDEGTGTEERGEDAEEDPRIGFGDQGQQN